MRCQGEGCGSTFIRSQDAFADQDASGYIDDLHAYQVQPKLAYIEAVTGNTPFPLGAGNEDMATLSVHNPLWTFNIDMSNAANASLIMDNIDDVELIITHEAYSLQAGYCAGRASAAELPPTPAYQPMQRVLDPESSPLLGVQMGEVGLAPAAGADGLTGRYAGAVAPVSPQYMPAFDLNLVLTATAGGPSAGTLAGYVDVEGSLRYPVTNAATGHGPTVAGSWSGEMFSLQTTQPFTVALSNGLIVTRSIILSGGVISQSGEILAGIYGETLVGLTPDPLVITGTFQMWRPPQSLEPAAGFSAFPVLGSPPLTVSFSDLSGGGPTQWSWQFGDGGVSTGQHPTHTYGAIGKYTVTLAVSNTFGTHSLTLPGLITVADIRKIYLPLVSRGAP